MNCLPCHISVNVSEVNQPVDPKSGIVVDKDDDAPISNYELKKGEEK